MTTTVVEIDSGDLVVELSSGGASGSADFLGLTDTPDSYSGQALKAVRVNAGATALEFATGGTATLADADYGDIVVSGSGTIFTYDGTVPVVHGGTGQTTEAEALGEMIQALSADATPDSAADYVVTYDASADTGKKVLLSNLPASSANRTLLTTDTTIYVRTAPTAVTMSTASPAVVAWNSHGLSANDPVVFSVASSRQACTLTIANPCVVSATSHGFVAGDQICFRTTGTLPTTIGPLITPNPTVLGQPQEARKTFYVLATSLTANTFRFAASPGGTAIDTSAGSQTGVHLVERARNIQLGTCTMSSTDVTLNSHGLTAGTRVCFTSTGALPSPLNPYGPPYLNAVNGLNVFVYYVLAAGLTANTFRVAEVDAGTAINVGGAASGTHTVYRFTPLPTPIQAGRIYYVLSSGLTANAFTFSATVGGSAINTSLAAVGVFQAQTGNDANTGSAATRTGAMLTLQAAYDYLTGSLDTGANDVTIQLADGTYFQEFDANFISMLDTSTGTWLGGGNLTITGNSANQNNVRLEMASGCTDLFFFNSVANGQIIMKFLDFFNPSFSSISCHDAYTNFFGQNLTFSGFCINDPHIFVTGGNKFVASNAWQILYGAGYTGLGFGSLFCIEEDLSDVSTSSTTSFTYYDSPVFNLGFIEMSNGTFGLTFSTYTGAYTGIMGTITGGAGRMRVLDSRPPFGTPGTMAVSADGEASFSYSNLDDSGDDYETGPTFTTLKLAEGGVINWDTGDATITQTANDITVAGVSTFGFGTSTAVTLGTIELGHASNSTLSASSGVLSIESHQVAVVDTENQALTGGVTVTEKDLGTVTTGTTTLDMGDRPMHKYTNNGAHTLAPGAVIGSTLIAITNGASAGAITTSGWTKVAGDSFTTTNGHKFLCAGSVSAVGSLLTVQAMQ